MLEEVNIMQQQLIIDSKLKKIYSKYDGYKALKEEPNSEALILFFEQIFILTWFAEKNEIWMSNKDIGRKTGYAESTIEKKLRALERCKLIFREIQRFFSNGRWQSVRRITLEASLIAMMYKELNLTPKNTVRVEPKITPEEEIISHDVKIFEEAPKLFNISKKRKH